MEEHFLHIPKFTFDNPVKDQRGNPLYTYDVILVSSAISKRLQDNQEMSIGFTQKYENRCLQIHHYNSRVLSLLEKWKVTEKEL